MDFKAFVESLTVPVTSKVTGVVNSVTGVTDSIESAKTEIRDGVQEFKTAAERYAYTQLTLQAISTAAAVTVAVITLLNYKKRN